MKKIILASLCFVALGASAQPAAPLVNDDPSKPRPMSQEGKAFSIQLTPGDPVRILVVGREEAKINLKQMRVTINRLSPGPKMRMKAERKGNEFTLIDKLDEGQATEIEVTTKSRGRSETFHFKLKDKP